MSNKDKIKKEKAKDKRKSSFFGKKKDKSKELDENLGVVFDETVENVDIDVSASDMDVSRSDVVDTTVNNMWVSAVFGKDSEKRDVSGDDINVFVDEKIVDEEDSGDVNDFTDENMSGSGQAEVEKSNAGENISISSSTNSDDESSNGLSNYSMIKEPVPVSYSGHTTGEVFVTSSENYFSTEGALAGVINISSSESSSDISKKIQRGAYSIIDDKPALNYSTVFTDYGANYSSMQQMEGKYAIDSSSPESSSGISSHVEEEYLKSDSNTGFQPDMLNYCSKDVLKDILNRSVDEYGLVKYLYKIMTSDFSTLDVDDLSKIINKSSNIIWELNNRFEDKIVLEVQRQRNYNRGVTKPSVTEDKRYMDFQWIEKFISADTPEEYARLNKSFLNTVEKLSKVIILEKNLPDFKKSIKPISIGGLAGGIKYLTYGILFKFAEDVKITPYQWLYGGDQADHVTAGKALNNDLKALRALVSVRDDISDLQMPIVNTVTYLGYTVVAMSFLPLKGNSQVYGTCDGGCTYANDGKDEKLTNIVLSVAKQFHFAQHPVEDKSGNRFDIWFGADVEIHKSGDDDNPVYFILDMGRFFPPNNPQNPFVNQFRAEYLQNLKHEEISCDAFVQFGSIEKDYYNDQARDLIANFELYIKKLIPSDDFDFSNGIHALAEDLHNKGINLRYLGFIRRALRSSLKENWWNFTNQGRSEIRGHEISKFKTLSQLAEEAKSTKKTKKKVKVKHSESSEDEIVEYQESQYDINNKWKQDYVLMEMILRSCKSVLQLRMLKRSEIQVIPNSDIYEDITYKFHLEISNQESKFWNSSILKCTIKQKFGVHALDDIEFTSSKSVLDMLHFPENIKKLISLVPDYCYYKGGRFLFEIENALHSKSSIPAINAEYIISELTGLVSEENLEVYWEQYKHLPAETILPLAVICWQKCTSGENSNLQYKAWIENFSETFLKEQNDNEDYFLLRELLQNTSITYFQNELKIERFPDDNTIQYVSVAFTGFQSHKIQDEMIERLVILQKITKVDVSGSEDLSDKGCVFISQLAKLKSLNISNCSKITDNGIKALVNNKSNLKKKLEYLDMSNCLKLRDDSVEHISKLLKLTELNIMGIHITDISSLVSLVKLKTLNMTNCFKVKNIVALGAMHRMQNMILTGCSGIEHLDGDEYHVLKNMKKLKVLEMANVNKFESTKFSLGFLPHLTRLTKLNISGNPCIEDIDLESALAPLCLQFLSIKKCRQITSNGLRSLNTKKLNQFFAKETAIDDKIFEILKDSRISHMDVTSTNITDAGLEKIDMMNTSNLKRIVLSKCSITDAGLDHISSCVNVITLIIHQQSQQDVIKSNKDILLNRMKDPVNGLQLTDREILFKKYKSCFSGIESVDFLIENDYASSRDEAVSFMREFEENGLLEHITKDREFMDKEIYFIWTENRQDISKTTQKFDFLIGKTSSSLEFLVKFENIRKLDLSGCGIFRDAFIQITKLPRLEYLDISEHRIDDENLKVISDMKLLLTLNMNKVHTLKGLYLKYIGKLVNLTNLSLEDTPISSKEYKTNIEYISTLINLKSLNLEHTGIIFQSPTIGGDTGRLYKVLKYMSQLESLNLSSNKIYEQFPVEPTLTELNLNYNPNLVGLKLTGEQSLQLKTLSLSGCSKFRVKEYEELQEITTLTDLDISDLPALVSDKYDVVRIPTLKKLNLTGSVNYSTLSKIAEGFPNLTHLNLSLSSQSITNEENVSKSLKRKKYQNSFEYVRVEWEKLLLEHPVTTSKGEITRLEKSLEKLTELEISNLKIPDDVLEILSRKESITSLNVENCTEITDAGIALIQDHPYLIYIGSQGCPNVYKSDNRDQPTKNRVERKRYFSKYKK